MLDKNGPEKQRGNEDQQRSDAGAAKCSERKRLQVEFLRDLLLKYEKAQHLDRWTHLLLSPSIRPPPPPPPTCNEKLIALIATVGVCMMGWNP